MNADMLSGDCIGVLEYRSIPLSVAARESPLLKRWARYLSVVSVLSVFKSPFVFKY